jgi:hypothetical protein
MIMPSNLGSSLWQVVRGWQGNVVDTRNFNLYLEDAERFILNQ